MTAIAQGNALGQQAPPLLPTHAVDQRPSNTRRLVFVEETTWSGAPTDTIALVTMQASLPPVEEVD